MKEDSVNVLKALPLSANSVKSRMDETAEEIENTAVSELKFNLMNMFLAFLLFLWCTLDTSEKLEDKSLLHFYSLNILLLMEEERQF